MATSSLLSYYCTIGSALLEYEDAISISSLNSLSSLKTCFKKECNQTLQAKESFRQNLVFIPLEVLEGYLDDLIGNKKNDEELFINNCGAQCRVRLLSLLLIPSGIVLALLSSSTLVAALWISVAMYGGLHFASMFGKNQSKERRGKLARVLAREISRRRGRTGTFGTTFLKADVIPFPRVRQQA